MPDFVTRARRHDHVQPLAARRLRGAGEHFDDVAVLQRCSQRNEFPVHARADTAMTDVGVNPIREIERRRAARKREDVAFRREGVDLVGIEINLQ